MASISSYLRPALTVIIVLAGLTVLFLMYYNSFPSPKCHPPPSHLQKPHTDKPVVLLWFWPENKMFDFQDCKTFFDIDSCHLTDDRSLYSEAHGVLLFHRAIQDDLSNLPTSPRKKFQRWIWFNTDSPSNTRRIEGIKSIFNLTMSYRKDADIHIRWRLTLRKKTDADFVLPKKERLLCWIVDSLDLNTAGEGYKYYKQLLKHIKVDIFDRSSAEFWKDENYFRTISSCKFYLSFENSIHKDYITEKFNGPLAAGTVPIVLGPPRINYEDFAPGNSFIHVNDFPDAPSLAEFLLKLDQNTTAYMNYFNWRSFYTARRHLTEQNHEFAYAICQACYYIGLGMNSKFRFVPDLYKWFLLL
ncbi:alpha-(1,3)-fucosyltransferase 9 [Etheostoma spectabile]|uniref:alpha-(1,3)-fucosyltransferase 9 n=1 Tax=Etheostoma spectabile TaxID=54343 RepID=UPI0013AF5EED|nr:alpha-(1,3)-fucosyltransferase 9-like [Etheostoma spectabile]